MYFFASRYCIDSSRLRRQTLTKKRETVTSAVSLRIVELRPNRTDHRPVRTQVIANLGGFALSFQGLLAANIDLDLLGLGFGLLSQANLQHALVIVGRDLLWIYGGG